MLAALRMTEWTHFRDYISPAALEVLPAGQLAREMSRLAGNFSRGRAFQEALGRRAEEWASLAPPIQVVSELPARGLVHQGLTGLDRQRAGHATLVLFFRLVLGGERVILDVRPSSLGYGQQGLLWKPARLWTDWSEDFASGVRDLYHGFYADEGQRFARGLRRLGLEAAEPAMRRHFGSGDQRAVRFELETFHDTFHDIFMTCRDAGVQLDSGFIGLGVLLAGLYETLQGLGGAFDVRKAWEASTQ